MSEKLTFFKRRATRYSFHTAKKHISGVLHPFAGRRRQLADTLKSVFASLENSKTAMALSSSLLEPFHSIISAFNATTIHIVKLAFRLADDHCVQEAQSRDQQARHALSSFQSPALFCNHAKNPDCTLSADICVQCITHRDGFRFCKTISHLVLPGNPSRTYPDKFSSPRTLTQTSSTFSSDPPSPFFVYFHTEQTPRYFPLHALSISDSSTQQ